MIRFLQFFLLFSFSFLTAQTIQSPSEFLGYELGTEFTRHHEVVDYYEYLAEVAKDRVNLIEYGQTNERRPLLLAFVSSASNITNLEAIRQEHIKNTEGTGKPSKAIVWLSYNVHGNESVSSEASMQTIYELLTSKSSYLDNTLVIMDPCINPDGRDRYSNWYKQFKNTPSQIDPNSKEHHEGWLNGRSNHYMFDLNRDWAWLTQVESQQRIKLYNKWLPHIHADFHEQGIDNPYYFAPAAEPYHEVITKFQRDFQVTIGKNHAKYFDANGWLYFTNEIFDLFYPSYGDTYPTYNGAIGMTYEQGGSGRAGLGIINKIGDTLTLKDRIAHHHTTGLSTVEIASKNTEKLNAEFKKFFERKNYKYKSYVLNGNKDKINALAKLLKHHDIEYGKASNGTIKGYDYKTNAIGSMKISENSLVVSTDQKKGTMVKVLFEPNAKLSDSLTYDITAWSLPYAYGLDAIASTNYITQSEFKSPNASSTSNINDKTYAYLTDWNSMDDARFLARLLKEGIKVRTTKSPIKIEGKSYDRGSLIITKSDNQNHKAVIDTLKKIITDNHNISLTAVNTGFADSGKDFGSSYVNIIAPPKIAVLSGKPTSTLRFGEIWHFFEKQLNYPVTVLDESYFKSVKLNKYDILILPEGRYANFLDENLLNKIKDWVKNGGNLIAMGNAINAINGKKGFAIKSKKVVKDTITSNTFVYENSQREGIKNAITGAIFKAKVDSTHPLAYGYNQNYFSLKLGNNAYEYLKSGNVAYIESNTRPISGFAGSKARKKIEKSLIFGVENNGAGNVVYMVDNPLFRGFWENGKLFFANALFMLD